MSESIKNRIDGLNWTELSQSLWENGYALTPALLSRAECTALTAIYPDESLFRSHIVMARYRFGLGDYKYFKYPLPALVHQIRESLYPHLAPVASEWNKALGNGSTYPD